MFDLSILKKGTLRFRLRNLLMFLWLGNKGTGVQTHVCLILKGPYWLDRMWLQQDRIKNMKVKFNQNPKPRRGPGGTGMQKGSPEPDCSLAFLLWASRSQCRCLDVRDIG